jgi:hypothetical protein
MKTLFAMAAAASIFAAPAAAQVPRVMKCGDAAQAFANAREKFGEVPAIEADGPPGSNQRLVIVANGKGEFSVFIVAPGGRTLCMVYFGSGLTTKPPGSPV